jgi:hypothetical protein
VSAEGQARERFRYLDAKAGNALDGRLYGDALNGLPHFGFVAAGRFFNLWIGGLLGVRGLFLDVVEFTLDFGLRALGAEGGFGGFGGFGWR